MLILIFLSSIIVVSACDDNNTFLNSSLSENNLDDNCIYVDGDAESGGNGSNQNPFSSLSQAIEYSNNNSRLKLKEGTYKSDLNTKLTVDKDLIIEGEGDVVVDGENKNFFFKILPSSSLTIKNIRFINGYTQDYSQLSLINNKGNLTINNCSFNNMNSVMGTILNENNLNLINTTVVNAKSINLAQILVNLGNSTIIDSDLTAKHIYNIQEVSPAVYNYNNLKIITSRIDEIKSNSEYDELSYKTPLIFIKNSYLTQVEIDNASVFINNTKFNNRITFRNSNVDVCDCVFDQQDSAIGLSIFNSNFTAVYSIFNCDISSGYVNLNITYSAVLGNMYGGGKYSNLYAPYNWWGINSGPSLSYFKNYDVSLWAVASFEYENSQIPVNPQGKFTLYLNKWSDGNNTYEFGENESIPLRYVRFESQSGKFIEPYKPINKLVDNYLVGNDVDGKVYAVIDRQRLALNVGNSISDNTYYVSFEGHDGLDDGSFEKPFFTLQYALSRVGNGNTICILGGVNKNPADSNVVIDKNITIIGLGDTTLVRDNSHEMFIIKEWGSLTVKNIKFTVTSNQYTNSIFQVSGGNLRIINSTFENITSEGVIYSYRGVENTGKVTIEDSKFTNIRGSAIRGVSKSYIFNTTFEKFTNFYHNRGFESFNTIFPVTNTIEIYDSKFSENTIGIINLHSFYYSGSALLKSSGDVGYSGIYAYVENSIFKNNQFNLGEYISSGTGFLIYDSYGSFNGYINNCSFISNDGPIAVATNVNNSIFIENTAVHGSNGLIKANSVYNSQFIKNSNIYKSGDGSFTGEGIVVADSVLNSSFEYNKAAFGGAVANAYEVHYCVFVNNTAIYGGNDIFSGSGDVDYSTNWWADNQKPDSDKIYKFLGTLTVSDWIIMSVEYSSNKEVKASLTNCIDDEGNIFSISSFPHKRLVSFTIDNGEVSPEITKLNNGIAYTTLNSDFNNDFKVYAIIDNQLLEVNVRNTHTNIIIDDTVFKGKNNKYSVNLVNVNGYKISNQTLLVEINDSQIFTIVTDENGHSEFNVDWPVGNYSVGVKYLGNGYFTKSSATANIEIVVSPTALILNDHVYFGKSNKFNAVLTGENENKLINFTLKFTISNLNYNSTLYAQSDNYGVGEILFTLDIGEYDILVEFEGDSWYSYSSAIAHIVVNPVNTTIIAPNITLYGEGNIYNITLKDIYGNLIGDENIYLTISQSGFEDNFTLKTNDLGVAGLTVNYLPGTYDLFVEYSGDEVYGSSKSNSTIKIQKVLTVVSGFSHTTIPQGGFYTVVLSDMYAKRINGENITLNIYKGELLKQYSLKCDGSGEASFKIDLDEGTYLVTFDYNGSQWYDASTNAATIVVSNDVKLADISINASDLVQYYGEDKYFIINFTDPNAYSQYGKTITATLSSANWSGTYNLESDVYGLVRLKITLNPGEYNITYKYSNDYYNLFASSSNKITVYKMPAMIYANDVVINKNDVKILEIRLKDINNNPIKNMQITASVDGKKQNITTNSEGIGKLILDLDVGEHQITYAIDNPNYISSNTSSRVLVVSGDKTSSKIRSHDVISFDGETLNYTVMLKDILGGGIGFSKVEIQIYTTDNESVLNQTGFTDSNGSIIFNLDLEYGKYIVNTVYEGSEEYLGSFNINTITIESHDNKTKTTLFSGSTQLVNSNDYFVILSDVNGILLKNKPVKVLIDGDVYNLTTDDEGRAYLNAELSANVYNIKAVFEGDGVYKKSSITSKLFVSGKSTLLYVTHLVKYYLNGTQFHARLVDSLLNPVAGEIITVVISNQFYNCTTDEEGWITLKIDLPPGKYDVECYHYGIEESENSFNKTSITVLSTISGHDESKYYGQSPYLEISFVDGSGKPINNTPFIIGIDGKNYYAQTNDDGKFLFDLNLNPGKHIISAVNPYDGLYVSYNLEILSTVFADDMTKVINSNLQYESFFLDNEGIPLINRNVNIIINGYRYVYKTNDYGSLSLNFNLKPGKYLVTAINPVTGQYVENNVVILPSIVENKDIVMYYLGGDSYKVRIISSGGNPVGHGISVVFKVNGKSYKIKTNTKGYAIFKIKLKPKKYTIAATYKGYSVVNKITVKPVLTAKNISKKISKVITFKAKLVNSKGKPSIGKKITFKLKSKKYISKTNKKGYAIIKIRNLKVGKYIIKTSCASSKISNRITVKK